MTRIKRIVLLSESRQWFGLRRGIARVGLLLGAACGVVCLCAACLPAATGGAL